MKAVLAFLTMLGNLLMELLTIWKARKEAREEEEHQNDHQAIDDDVVAELRRRGMLTPPDSKQPADPGNPGLPRDEAGDVRDIRTRGEDQ
jgi:hypothetical protein